MRLGLLTGQGAALDGVSRLRELGLLDTAGQPCVTGDDVPRPKPDPDGLADALGAASMSAQRKRCSWAIPGRTWALAAAAGVRTVRVRWNALMDEVAPRRLAGPDWTVERPEQVLALLGWDELRGRDFLHTHLGIVRRRSSPADASGRAGSRRYGAASS